MASRSKKSGWIRIKHEQILIKARRHSIDILVFPICQKLWVAGVKTFYSCQGGPTFLKKRTGKIHCNRAYVQILLKDSEKVLDILKAFHPEIDWNPKSLHKDRVCIRFDPPNAKESNVG
jgi:hypothetical protein